ncbi:MAG: DUF5615 family PIN-like protein [Chloroflexi bacterium]|nr:DUF5615 family PIN-like protein [Chloroflexota bacterium]
MSPNVLLDENLPPGLAADLRALGYDATHVREAGLKGRRDSEVIAFACTTRRCLITLDADFADLRRYPLGSHCGIIRPFEYRLRHTAFLAAQAQRVAHREGRARRYGRQAVQGQVPESLVNRASGPTGEPGGQVDDEEMSHVPG